MTIHRVHGCIAFECDGCGEVLETNQGDFYDALAELKKTDWRIIKVVGGHTETWEHRCPDCEDEEE